MAAILVDTGCTGVQRQRRDEKMVEEPYEQRVKREAYEAAAAREAEQERAAQLAQGNRAAGRRKASGRK